MNILAPPKEPIMVLFKQANIDCCAGLIRSTYPQVIHKLRTFSDILCFLTKKGVLLNDFCGELFTHADLKISVRLIAG